MRRFARAFVFCSVLYPHIALAQVEPTNPVVDEIAAEINSPFCPGRLLRDCPSTAAHSLKEQIKERLAKGESKSQIREALIEQYGSDINPLPETAGFGLVAWLAPVFFLGFSLLGGLLWLIRRKAP